MRKKLFNHLLDFVYMYIVGVHIAHIYIQGWIDMPVKVRNNLPEHD